MHNKKIKYTEFVLISFLWLVLLFTPILFREDIYSPLRRTVFIQLEILLPLLALFLINRFILGPRLLFKGKQLLFIVTVFGLITLFTAGITSQPGEPPFLNEYFK